MNMNKKILKSITTVFCLGFLLSCIITTSCFADGTFYILAGCKSF